MPNGYHHLTRDQRCQIDILLKRGDSKAVIAKTLGIHPSTISREIKKNSAVKQTTKIQEYRYEDAHRKALRRRREVSSRPSKMTTEIKNIIKDKLSFQWSPDQISGWLKLNNIVKVSHETIYKMIYKDKCKGGVLYQNLRRYGRKYHKRMSRKKHCGIPNRVDIDQRPSIVELKQRVGDWEVDTIIGKGQIGAVVTMVDRASKLTKMYYVSNKTSQNVVDAMTCKLLSIKEHVITITADNGGEFSKHEEVSKKLNADFYFAKPYHAWERGLNEHTNGLIRQYIPKNIPIINFTQEKINEIEDLLNNRPRKVLNYLTPIEAYKKLTINDEKNCTSELNPGLTSFQSLTSFKT
jgi:IS30 family transposase